MLRFGLILLVVLVPVAGWAQQPPLQNPQVVITEIVKRQQEEMQKAISCEIHVDDLQHQIDKLKGDLAEAQKPK